MKVLTKELQSQEKGFMTEKQKHKDHESMSSQNKHQELATILLTLDVIKSYLFSISKMKRRKKLNIQRF